MRPFVTFLLAVLVIACGNSDTDPLPAPARAVGHTLYLSDLYISGSPCADVVGTLPGKNWENGTMIYDRDQDGWLAFDASDLPNGDYRVTYRDRECPGESPQKNWADYGHRQYLSQMTDASRCFVYCTWWSASQGREVASGDPHCELRFRKNRGGLFPLGNMQNAF